MEGLDTTTVAEVAPAAAAAVSPVLAEAVVAEPGAVAAAPVAAVAEPAAPEAVDQDTG